MTNELIPDDDLLLRISDAFDRDLPPVPGRLSSVASEAFQWRRADVALAELLFDSAQEDLVGIRGTSTERRSFRYAAGDAVVRVHLTAATMIVMVEPPLSVTCRVESGAGDGSTKEHRTDELGELAVDAPAFPLRVEFDLPGGTYTTPWITG
ncbi:hypothetical protein BDK89_1311 [Ilumatobacter fluminis]|uniref:Uncharacterized protein n=1 Tax=Ilumatobacter fluminis TaxID=467091 RepID=A0A4R7HZX5_9ACTN|nr:hypothetical protein [Ilumatobacter fluminis]TDT15733.1 hypothetical protein BDK89_1311 [Ilumatobacter fluminis]